MNAFLWLASLVPNRVWIQCICVEASDSWDIWKPLMLKVRMKIRIMRHFGPITNKLRLTIEKKKFTSFQAVQLPLYSFFRMARRFRQIEWLNTLWLSLSKWNDKQIICFSSHTQKSSVFEQCVPFSLSELSQWVQLIHRLINANVKYIAWQCVYNPSFCMYIARYHLSHIRILTPTQKTLRHFTSLPDIVSKKKKKHYE